MLVMASKGTLIVNTAPSIVRKIGQSPHKHKNGNHSIVVSSIPATVPTTSDISTPEPIASRNTALIIICTVIIAAKEKPIHLG